MSTSSSPPATERLSPTQVRVLVTLERVGGSVSLVAVLFIFVAYALVRRARNVQNTFIIFASVSNVGASVASIIALDGVRAGEDTALCQTQSFLFEMCARCPLAPNMPPAHATARAGAGDVLTDPNGGTT